MIVEIPVCNHVLVDALSCVLVVPVFVLEAVPEHLWEILTDIIPALVQ